VTVTTDAPARPRLLRPIPFHYCPGCGHSVLHELLAGVLDELALSERAIGVSSVGCSFLMYDFLDVDFASAPPGRAPSVATGIKRARPDAAVFTYQGDGDALGAGLGDLVHAIARNEKITLLVVNNSALGLSGGQLSPTVLPGQRTRTTPTGRDPGLHGHPIRLCEMVRALAVPARVERVALDTPTHIQEAHAAVRESFRHAMDGRGTALLEVLSACPTYWDLSPEAAGAHITRHLSVEFPPARFDRRAPVDPTGQR
jgi:2-oxoglutarate ferredoxin oxidoreductase subunit beta